MSNQNKSLFNTKLVALGYFRNSETNTNVVEDQVFKASKRYAQGLLDAGLVEEANHNSKVGLGNPELKLKRIKEAGKKAQNKAKELSKANKEKHAKYEKEQALRIKKNIEAINKQ